MCILQWPGSTVLCSSFTFDISRHLRLQLLRLFPGIISWEINPRLYRSVSSGTGHKQCSLEAASEFRTAFPSFSAIVCRVRNDVVLCALFSCINSFCCIWYYSDLCSLDFPVGQIMLPEGIILKKYFLKSMPDKSLICLLLDDICRAGKGMVSTATWLDTPLQHLLMQTKHAQMRKLT